jgi:hypothetical protein
MVILACQGATLDKLIKDKQINVRPYKLKNFTHASIVIFLRFYNFSKLSKPCLIIKYFLASQAKIYKNYF